MQKKNYLLSLLTLLTFSVCYGQINNFSNQQIKSSEDSISVIQIKTDSIFNSNQIISLMLLKKNDTNRFSIEFGYSYYEPY